MNTTDRVSDLNLLIMDYNFDGREGRLGVYHPVRNEIVDVFVTPGIHRLLAYIGKNSKEGETLWEDGKKFLIPFADQVIHGYPLFNSEWCEACDQWIATH